MVGCPFLDDYGLQFLEHGCPTLQVKYFMVENSILVYNLVDMRHNNLRKYIIN